MTINTAPETADAAAQVVEQEWCIQCAIDIDAEPGMGQDIVATATQIDPATPWYAIISLYLACGHTVVVDTAEEPHPKDLLNDMSSEGAVHG